MCLKNESVQDSCVLMLFDDSSDLETSNRLICLYDYFTGYCIGIPYNQPV